jgi:hypothetical protein
MSVGTFATASLDKVTGTSVGYGDASLLAEFLRQIRSSATADRASKLRRPPRAGYFHVTLPRHDVHQAFLGQVGLAKVPADAAAAARFRYGRAVGRGLLEAKPQLDNFEIRQAR